MGYAATRNIVKQLVKAHIKEEPGIIKAIWNQPNKYTIRIIEIIENWTPSEKIEPFKFEHSIDLTIELVLVSSDEFSQILSKTLNLPNTWNIEDFEAIYTK